MSVRESLQEEYERVLKYNNSLVNCAEHIAESLELGIYPPTHPVSQGMKCSRKTSMILDTALVNRHGLLAFHPSSHNPDPDVVFIVQNSKQENIESGIGFLDGLVNQGFLNKGVILDTGVKGIVKRLELNLNGTFTCYISNTLPFESRGIITPNTSWTHRLDDLFSVGADVVLSLPSANDQDFFRECFNKIAVSETPWREYVWQPCVAQATKCLSELLTSVYQTQTKIKRHCIAYVSGQLWTFLPLLEKKSEWKAFSELSYAIFVSESIAN